MISCVSSNVWACSPARRVSPLPRLFFVGQSEDKSSGVGPLGRLRHGPRLPHAPGHVLTPEGHHQGLSRVGSPKKGFCLFRVSKKKSFSVLYTILTLCYDYSIILKKNEDTTVSIRISTL